MPKTVLALLLLCPVLQADSGWRKAWRASVGLLVACSAADVASSWGKTEANPLLASPSGRFGTRGLAIKGGVLLGVLVVQKYVVKEEFGQRVATVANVSAAGVLAGVAARNFTRNVVSGVD